MDALNTLLDKMVFELKVAREQWCLLRQEAAAQATLVAILPLRERLMAATTARKAIEARMKNSPAPAEEEVSRAIQEECNAFDALINALKRAGAKSDTTP